MNKIQPKFNQERAREAPKGPVHRQIMSYCENEIRPLLELLNNRNTPLAIKNSLKRFLVISLISTFEFYFKNMASKYVDSNNVDLTQLFKDEICFKLSDLEIDLFKYLYTENSKDKCKMMIRKGPPIDINYEHLFNAYDLRNRVVHGLSDVPYSYTHILKLWDNAMNIFDIANTIFTSSALLQQFRLQYGRNHTK